MDYSEHPQEAPTTSGPCCDVTSGDPFATGRISGAPPRWKKWGESAHGPRSALSGTSSARRLELCLVRSIVVGASVPRARVPPCCVSVRRIQHGILKPGGGARPMCSGSDGGGVRRWAPWRGAGDRPCGRRDARISHEPARDRVRDQAPPSEWKEVCVTVEMFLIMF